MAWIEPEDFTKLVDKERKTRAADFLTGLLQTKRYIMNLSV